MILDNAENLARYEQLKQVLASQSVPFQKGKFEINGAEFFGIGLEYDTKPASEGLWEAHRINLDVHFILEGEEFIHVSSIDQATETKTYDPEGDYALFDASPQQIVHLKKGMFLALYPNEVHKTAVQVNEVSSVKKIVFKVKL